MKDNMFMAMFRKMLVENRRRILILGWRLFHPLHADGLLDGIFPHES